MKASFRRVAMIVAILDSNITTRPAGFSVSEHIAARSNQQYDFRSCSRANFWTLDNALRTNASRRGASAGGA
jgi:hypothetical protein